ncbi:P-loop containing nucleoside triphosphate hydrolase [Phycisphaerae bacterium RAS1]|nr:P-loop containing nucleoside triphosphate hydrolase [Phycisphaerae bacterium RAS1]
MSDVLLAAEDVHKTYRMGRATLNVLLGCNLRLAKGEFVAIMGKSGSGKSTLLHVLGALDVPERGQVTFAGQPVFAAEGRRRFRPGPLDVLLAAERRRNELRRRVFGFVFQFYHLLPELNVLENVLITHMVGTSLSAWPARRAAARGEALEIIGRVGLSDRLRHRPGELSGGERQRVAIARALVHRPQVLLADEPTGNLDAQAGASLMKLLKEFHAEGQTIVMVTHDPQIAAYADRTLRLEEGRLRGGGN